jgi:hypothetical protein
MSRSGWRVRLILIRGCSQGHGSWKTAFWRTGGWYGKTLAELRLDGQWMAGLRR